MTERKPPGVEFESWVDRQIREAAERGELDDLPGAGRPLPREDGPHDELWWVKGKLAREGLSFLPPSLALRKEAQDAREAAVRAPTEARARRIVEDVNERIREAIRTPPEGPSVTLAPLDLAAVLAERRAAR